MSWFYYGEHTKKHIGVYLRYDTNPDIQKLIKKSKNLRILDFIFLIKVKEYFKKEDEVLLEIWSRNFFDVIRRKTRYNVFYIRTKVNRLWICEGNFGAGEKF